MPDALRLAGRVRESIVDGPGLRYTIFTQGCPHHCPGCHNVHTWPSDGGNWVDTSEILREIRRDTLLQGVTFSGGEPFEQAEALVALAEQIREIPLGIWVYTGYTWEEIMAAENPAWHALLAQTDVLVDGRFVESEKSYALTFRGSANQRMLDVRASLTAGQPVLYLPTMKRSQV